MINNWKQSVDGQGVRRHQVRSLKVFDYRKAPTVGQGLTWVLFGPFGRMVRSGFARTLRQAKSDALRAEANP